MTLRNYGQGSPFHDVVKNPGLATSLLSIIKWVLKVPVTAVPLFSMRQEAMGTKIKMRQYGEVGIIHSPISILNCGEEDASSSQGADCYAHYLLRIVEPSGYGYLSR